MILNLDKNSEGSFQKIGAKNDTTLDGLFYLSFLQKSLAGRGPFSSFQLAGYVRNTLQHYVSKLTDMGGSVIVNVSDSHSTTAILQWDDSVAEISRTNSDYLVVNILSFSENLIKSINEAIKIDFVTPKKKGSVFAIMRYGSSLSLRNIGFAGTALEKDNYNADIVADYNYIIKDLNSSQPTGRIAIFDGPPGTGKTFMVRSLLLDVPNAMFVLVPPAMVSSLGGPEILPMLLDHRQSYGKTGPTIFLLEDADSCLAPRGADNMDSITSILNIGDGIFGSLFDIRIVATTNAKQKDMDGAVIRAGRLSKKIRVGRLGYNDASRIFNRLLPDVEMPKHVETVGFGLNSTKDNDWSLAEVYKLARDHGWEPPALATALEGEDPDTYDDDEDDDE